MNLPSVSVIIPAFNARSTIVLLVKSLLIQSYQGSIEIIIVDDGSIDGTLDELRPYSGIRCFTQKNQGPASARNHGARKATGEILIFTDSDCCPEKEWVDKMVGGFLDSTIGAVAGSYGVANPDSWLARIINAEIRFRHCRLMPQYSRSFGSYNVAIPQDVFRGTGGFNEGYRRASGEDNDLSYKILNMGKKIHFVKGALVAHFHQDDWACYLKEQYRHGFWRAQLYKDHPDRVGGDDYTFWKDLVEVPWVLLHLIGLLNFSIFVPIVGLFFIFEIIAGVGMVGFSVDGIRAGIVMWTRSYARTFGFMHGVGCIFLPKLRPMKKI